jgi:hypothetical protein
LDHPPPQSSFPSPPPSSPPSPPFYHPLFTLFPASLSFSRAHARSFSLSRSSPLPSVRPSFTSPLYVPAATAGDPLRSFRPNWPQSERCFPVPLPVHLCVCACACARVDMCVCVYMCCPSP